jgi:methionine-rich copper-binding protein CopC
MSYPNADAIKGFSCLWEFYKFRWHYSCMTESNRAFLPKDKETLRLFKKVTKHKPSYSVIVLFSIQYLIGIGLFSLPVYSHPSTIAYKPQPNQTINSTETLPTEVTIVFTETPEPRASSILVMDSNYERVDNIDLNVGWSDKALSVSLDKSNIMLGNYTITWLILSKDDGYTSKGHYAFSFVEDDGRHQQQ